MNINFLLKKILLLTLLSISLFSMNTSYSTPRKRRRRRAPSRTTQSVSLAVRIERLGPGKIRISSMFKQFKKCLEKSIDEKNNDLLNNILQKFEVMNEEKRAQLLKYAMNYAQENYHYKGLFILLIKAKRKNYFNFNNYELCKFFGKILKQVPATDQDIEKMRKMCIKTIWFSLSTDLRIRNSLRNNKEEFIEFIQLMCSMENEFGFNLIANTLTKNLQNKILYMFIASDILAALSERIASGLYPKISDNEKINLKALCYKINLSNGDSPAGSTDHIIDNEVRTITFKIINSSLSENDCIDWLRFLIEKKFLFLSYHGKSLLEIATEQKRWEIVSFLIPYLKENGSDMDIDSFKQSFIFAIALREKAPVEILDLILETYKTFGYLDKICIKGTNSAKNPIQLLWLYLPDNITPCYSKEWLTKKIENLLELVCFSTILSKEQIYHFFASEVASEVVLLGMSVFNFIICINLHSVIKNIQRSIPDYFPRLLSNTITNDCTTTSFIDYKKHTEFAKWCIENGAQITNNDLLSICGNKDMNEIWFSSINSLFIEESHPNLSRNHSNHSNQEKISEDDIFAQNEYIKLCMLRFKENISDDDDESKQVLQQAQMLLWSQGKYDIFDEDFYCNPLDLTEAALSSVKTFEFIISKDIFVNQLKEFLVSEEKIQEYLFMAIDKLNFDFVYWCLNNIELIENRFNLLILIINSIDTCLNDINRYSASDLKHLKKHLKKQINLPLDELLEEDSCYDFILQTLKNHFQSKLNNIIPLLFPESTESYSDIDIDTRNIEKIYYFFERWDLQNFSNFLNLLDADLPSSDEESSYDFVNEYDAHIEHNETVEDDEIHNDRFIQVEQSIQRLKNRFNLIDSLSSTEKQLFTYYNDYLGKYFVIKHYNNTEETTIDLTTYSGHVRRKNMEDLIIQNNFSNNTHSFSSSIDKLIMLHGKTEFSNARNVDINVFFGRRKTTKKAIQIHLYNREINLDNIDPEKLNNHKYFMRCKALDTQDEVEQFLSNTDKYFDQFELFGWTRNDNPYEQNKLLITHRFFRTL